MVEVFYFTKVSGLIKRSINMNNLYDHMMWSIRMPLWSTSKYSTTLINIYRHSYIYIYTYLFNVRSLIFISLSNYCTIPILTKNHYLQQEIIDHLHPNYSRKTISISLFNHCAIPILTKNHSSLTQRTLETTLKYS